MFTQPIMSSPSTTPKRGIMIVNSGITAKDVLDPETFRRWYEEVHILHILETSGVKSAYRFKAVASAESDSILGARPFLAVYPMDVDWAAHEDSEMWRVPVVSEMLPNESGNIFELADFQTGIYEKIGGVGEAGGPEGNVVVVSVDGGEVERRSGEDLEGLLRDSISGVEVPVRSTLFRWVYAPRNAPSPEESPAGSSLITSYLAFHEFTELPAGGLVGKDGTEARVFSRLSSFGEVGKTW